MGIKQRAYPAPDQVPTLLMHCSHARFLYNLGLEQRSYWRPWRRYYSQKISAMSQSRELTEVRREHDWLRAGSAVVQQGALRDLDRAFGNFFAGRADYPTFRKKSGKQSFVIRDLSVHRLSRRTAEVLVPKAGWVRFRLSRTWPEVTAATSARMSLDRAGRWHVSFTCEPADFQRVSTGSEVGIDRGAVNSLALSDGTMSHAPGWTPGEQARFLMLQQRLARQHKDSARWERTRLAIAVLHARLADRRRDWVEQTTTRLVREHDLIAIERLNTAGMTRKPKPKPDPDRPKVFLLNGARAKAALNKAILASCWGAFERRLTDKATRTPDHAPCVVVRVDPRNTSRRCAACGHTSADNRESQAVFVCQSCGHTAHADTNAAVNILDRAHTLQPEDIGGSDASVPPLGGPRQPTTCAA